MASVIFFDPAALVMVLVAAIATGANSISLRESVFIESALSSAARFCICFCSSFVFVARLFRGEGLDSVTSKPLPLKRRATAAISLFADYKKQSAFYAFGTGGQIRNALFGPFGACTNSGTTECPFNPKGDFATAGA
jgi:hypothetical protein